MSISCDIPCSSDATDRREQIQQDDQAAEKLHLAAVHGELRVRKRNRGLGLEDSDDEEESDEEHNRRIRQNIHKRSRIDRDDIKSLGTSLCLHLPSILKSCSRRTFGYHGIL